MNFCVGNGGITKPNNNLTQQASISKNSKLLRVNLLRIFTPKIFDEIMEKMTQLIKTPDLPTQTPHFQQLNLVGGLRLRV